MADSSVILVYDVIKGQQLDSYTQILNQYSAPVLVYRTIPILEVRLVTGSGGDPWPDSNGIAANDVFAFSVDKDGVADDTPMARAVHADFVLNPDSGDASILQFPLDCTKTQFKDGVAGERPLKPINAEGQLYVTAYGDTYPYLVASFRFRLFNVVDDFSAAAPA